MTKAKRTRTPVTHENPPQPSAIHRAVAGALPELEEAAGGALVDNGIPTQPAQAPQREPAPHSMQIKTPLWCKRCLDECPEGEKMIDFNRLYVGLTAWGFQVWCIRHKVNVAHIDHIDAPVTFNLKAPAPEPTAATPVQNAPAPATPQ